jgi:hypothetical protein
MQERDGLGIWIACLPPLLNFLLNQMIYRPAFTSSMATLCRQNGSVKQSSGKRSALPPTKEFTLPKDTFVAEHSALEISF